MEYKEIEDLIAIQKCSEVMEAIQAIKPGTQVTINAQQKIIWNDGNPTGITAQQVADKVAELRIEYEAQEYARKRRAEYPTIEDLVVALYDTDDKAAIDSKRAEIKLKYPKP
jgi:hypothetical protein